MTSGCDGCSALTTIRVVGGGVLEGMGRLYRV